MTPVSLPAAPRRVLIVSPHFPPINAPDHQRVRMSLPYGSFTVTFELGESHDEAYARLGEFFQAALDGFPPAAWPPRNDAFFNRNFLAENLTAQQCALFEAAVAGTATGRTTGAANRDQRTDLPCVERK